MKIAIQIPQVDTSKNDSATRLNEDGQIISLEQLINLLKDCNFNSKLVSLIYFGDYAKSRQKNGLKTLKKASYNRVFVGHNYQNKVNARLKKQANDKGIDFEQFKAQKANGLEKVSDLLFKNKKGQYRLRAYHGHENSKGIERASKTINLGFYESVSFQPISEAEATERNLFAPSHFKENNYVSGRGALTENDDFKVCNYSLENIAKIVLNGNVYTIR